MKLREESGSGYKIDLFLIKVIGKNINPEKVKINIDNLNKIVANILDSQRENTK